MKLNDNDILTILTAAKFLYLMDNVYAKNNGDFAIGMCHYIQQAIFKFTERKLYVPYRQISNFIPEFIPETFNIDKNKITGYWWSSSNTCSRINAFDKLIYIYERKCKNKQ